MTVPSNPSDGQGSIGSRSKGGRRSCVRAGFQDLGEGMFLVGPTIERARAFLRVRRD